MIIIKLDKAQYEYDIHSLVKAFYPEAEVRILTPYSVIKDKKILALPHTMELTFGENGEPVTLRIAEPDGSLAAEDEEPGRREPERLYTWHPDEEERTEYKNAFKRFLYKSLQKETGLTLPWGNLTGIRPTKIAMNMLEEGENTAQIEAFLRTRHLVSGEKAALSIDIAKESSGFSAACIMMTAIVCISAFPSARQPVYTAPLLLFRSVHGKSGRQLIWTLWKKRWRTLQTPAATRYLIPFI